MMSKDIFNIDYSKLKSLDIVFTHARNPAAGLIRIGETGKLSGAWDRSIVNHVGLITEDWGQYYLTEVKGDGPEENSLDLYKKTGNQILCIWRWDGFEQHPERIEAGLRYLSMWRRRKQGKGYDWFGAIRSSEWVRKLLPWLRQDESKPFCSESVYDFLWLNEATFPLDWRKQKPNPLQLIQWFTSHTNEYHLVTGWKI
jgi:hypothetical protein